MRRNLATSPVIALPCPWTAPLSPSAIRNRRNRRCPLQSLPAHSNFPDHRTTSVVVRILARTAVRPDAGRSPFHHLNTVRIPLWIGCTR